MVFWIGSNPNLLKNMMRFVFVYFLCLTLFGSTQIYAKTPKLRNNYDVLSYSVTLKVQPEKKFIEGANKITICAIKDLRSIELDLFPQLQISAINGTIDNIPFARDSNTFKLQFSQKIRKGDTVTFTVNFSGKPIEAKNAPWDGGFVWAKDSNNNSWVGLACEGVGPSCWFPCKDEWNDEANTSSVKLIVANGLIGVSNGRLLSKKIRMDGFTEFDWQELSPINTYNISINIADYAHLEDVYLNEKGEQLSLDYYVLKDNVARAKTHFQQAKRMLQSFEKYFGPYPFYKDGYKLVETPYWGMEHQSCVAYGNNYQNNKFGFDFIIVHESGHEWFANSITASDKADMWIHEGFTTYSEMLYVEKQYGAARAVQYIAGQKNNIKNATPMIGPYGVNYNRTDNDLYYKGAWILHTMRGIIDNDTLWFNTIKDLNKTFYHQIVTSKQLEDFFCSRTSYNFKAFFEQYLYQAKLPVLEYFIVEKDGLNELHYRLNANVKSLKLPVKVTLSKGAFDFLTFTKRWQIIDLPYSNPADFKIDEKHFLVELRKVNAN